MKHHTQQEITAAATVIQAPQRPALSYRQRIERWAALLDNHGGGLNALREIEYLPPAIRRAYRGDDTPLTVAYNDQVLREEGLKSDRLGDAMDFFGMKNADAHRLLCGCHYLSGMTGERVAGRLRSYAARQDARAGWRQAIRRFFGFAV